MSTPRGGWEEMSTPGGGGEEMKADKINNAFMIEMRQKYSYETGTVILLCTIIMMLSSRRSSSTSSSRGQRRSDKPNKEKETKMEKGRAMSSMNNISNRDSSMSTT